MSRLVRQRRRRRGVTLIEAMVAILITSIIGTLVWGGFDQTSRNKARVEAGLDRFHTLRIALERMSREISMAFVSTHINENPQLQAVRTVFIGTDRGGGDRLDFCSFSHQRLYRNAHESDQNEISYFITNHPDGGRKVLARREQARIDDDPEHGGRVQILFDDVKDFQLEYLDPASNEWLRTWNTTQGATGQPNRLPSQVKISITIPSANGRREETYGTRATIPIVWGLNHAVYNP